MGLINRYASVINIVFEYRSHFDSTPGTTAITLCSIINIKNTSGHDGSIGSNRKSQLTPDVFFLRGSLNPMSVFVHRII